MSCADVTFRLQKNGSNLCFPTLTTRQCCCHRCGEKVLILSALQKIAMNGKCDSKVFLFTYKEEHIFVLRQYFSSLCTRFFLCLI